MKNTRTVFVSLFLLIALFFIFRSAQASPFGADQPVPSGYQSEALTDPALDSPTVRLAPDQDVDLSVGILDVPDPVLVTQNLTYTVVVTNITGIEATNVVMTDTLDASVNLVYSTTLQGSCTGTSVIRCELGTIAAGSSTEVIIVVTPNSTGIINNSAVAKATENDPVPGNNTDSVNTTVNPLADLSLTLQVSNATPYVGSNIAFTVTVTNLGPSQATGVSAEDLLPAGYSFNSYSAGQGTYVGGTGIWTIGDLNPSASTYLRLNVTVNASGSYSNNAQVLLGNETDPVGTNNAATLATNPLPVADLSISKTGSTTAIAGKDTVFYTLTPNNAGLSTATTVLVTDTLPLGMTYVPATNPGWNCSVDGRVVSCTRASLDMGDGPVINVTVNVNPDARGFLTNRSRISSAVADLDLADNLDTWDTDVTGEADLSLALTVSDATPYVGSNITFTVTVTNLGPSQATGLSVEDLFPTGFGYTYASHSASQGTTYNSGTDIWTIGSLDPNSSANLRLNVSVNASGNYSMYAQVLPVNETDPVGTNNDATLPTTPIPVADLSLTKTNTPATVAAGEYLTYTLTVVNNGPSSASTLVLTETLPAGVAWQQPATGAWSCIPVSVGVRCTLASLPAGQTSPVKIRVLVSPSLPAGTLDNTATVKSVTYESNLDNNTASKTTNVIVSTDLAITKVDNPDNGVVAGETLVYTLTVTNNGPSDATGVTISDTLPAALTNASSVPHPQTCKIQGGVLGCTLGNLAAGASSPVVVTATVNANTPAGTQLSNTAAVNATSDPVSGNNRATQLTNVITSADLSITKVANPEPVIAGNDLVYTLTVTNIGPSDAVGVTISDTLPAALTIQSVSPESPGCTVTGQRVSCTLGTLAFNNTSQVVITATLAANTPVGTQLSNTAVVDSTTPDPVSGDNRFTLVTAVATSADLSIIKIANPNPVVAGTELVYTLTVTNDGPSAATGLTISDTLPVELTDVFVVSGNWSCNLPGPSLNCTLGTLAVDDTSPVVVKAKVAASTPNGTQLNNAATVTSADTPDPISGNNRGTQVTMVTTSADLTIAKIDKPDNGVVAGNTLVYTLTVSNPNGPSDAVEVTISDTLPAALTEIVVSPGPSCGVANQLLTCNIGKMVVGASSRVVVTAKVNAATLPGNLTNSAVVNSGTSDPATANNRATQVTTVTTLADPSITKVDIPDNGVIAGTSLVYNLTVSNPGPSNAVNVVVSDTLPASVTYQSFNQGPFGCNYDPGTRIVTCNLTTLAPNQPAQAVITVKVNSSTPVGTINNAATVSTTTADANAANNRATQSTSVITQADLSIAKQDGPDPVVAGTNLVYTLTVTDGGSSDALNVVVTDNLPDGLTYQSFGGDGWTCTSPEALKVRCTRPSLVAGTSSSVQITSTVGSGITLPLFNHAVVVSDTPDPDPSYNSATATTDVITQADVGVSVLHNPEPVIAGTEIVYTITVANDGPSDSQNVVLTENLPAGTSYVNMNFSGGTCTQNVRTITCNFTPIVAGTNRQVVVTALVASGTTGIINNVASLNGTGGGAPNNRTIDPNPANDSHTDPATIITRSDFSLLMVDKPDPVVAGTNLVYTLTVTNNGDSNSADAVVTDTLPSGVTYQSYAGTGWACTDLGDGRVHCSRPGMVADTSSSVAIKVLVNSGTTLPLSNSAVVGSTTVDPFLANNTDQETTTVITRANLGVAKLDKPDPVVAGTNLTYTVTVTNQGPSDAVGVVFTDTLPAAVIYQPSTYSGWNCTLNGVRLRCEHLANLVASTNDKVVIQTRVKSATTAPLSNSVLVRSSTTDLFPDNNTITEATTVRTSADLKISKVENVDPVPAGTGMAYTIVITNTGPSDAVGVKITDTLPAGVSYITHIPNKWVCPEVVGQLRCYFTDPVLASTRLQLDVAVWVDEGATGTLNNLVRVGATTADPLPANNIDTEITTVAPQSDLSITKVESIDPVIAGTNLTYTITVSNAGPSHAANLVVTDTLPANVTYQSFGGNSGWSCDLPVGNQLRCELASLNKDVSSTLSIVTKVLSSATGSLNNKATVRSAWPDLSLGDNSAEVLTTVNTRADMSVNKTDSPDPVAEGQPLTYKVVVKNNGPSDAVGVTLNDPIPSAVTLVSAVSVPQGTCSDTAPVFCSLGYVASGNTITITIATTANPVASTPKNISNTATVSTTTTDPIPSNDAKMVWTQVLPVADLQVNVVPQVLEVQTGHPMTYTLWITNTGPSIANNVVVTDTLPAEMTYKSSSLTPVSTSPKVVWNLGNLPVEGNTTLELVVDVTSPTKTLLNQVAAKSTVWDLIPASNQAQTNIQAFDLVAPTAEWKLPVTNEGSVSVGNEIIRLEVLATDNVAVDRVRFYRWDTSILDFVEIGIDNSASTCQFNPAFMCFQWDLDTTILNPEWNDIRARAYDESGNFYPPLGQYIRILIYRNVSTLYLPFVKK